MICHFSCGATSAIATALALKEDPEAEIIYADTGAEHPDNQRFLKDCEDVIFKKKVTVLKHPDYKDLYDHLEKNECVAFIGGAKCTSDLKKKVIVDYLGERLVTEEHVYGYDTGEIPRIERYKANNPEIKLRLPLIEHNLSKPNCLSLLQYFEVEIPEPYKMGYDHSNCLGCVKASNLPYWAAIREDFPDVFEWMAKHERRIGAIDTDTGKRKGATINKRYINGERHRLFLDELPEDIKPRRDFEISCGYSCGNVAEILTAGRRAVKDREEVDSVFEWLTGPEK